MAATKIKYADTQFYQNSSVTWVKAETISIIDVQKTANIDWY